MSIWRSQFNGSRKDKNRDQIAAYIKETRGRIKKDGEPLHSKQRKHNAKIMF
ncbi:MAG: hypothetical protein M3162_01105 [Thermoproteota archaeon]|nr:hypothetical protein [Thermoproteota archaeon]